MAVEKSRKVDLGDVAAVAALGLSWAGAMAFPGLSGAFAASSAALLGWRLHQARRSAARDAGTRIPDGASWCVGGDRDGRRQVWLTDAEMLRQSVYACGPGGARLAREFTIGLMSQALARGCGVVHVGHGPIGKDRRFVGAASALGRADDCLHLDLGRHRDDAARLRGRVHGWDPFAKGAAPDLAETVAGMFEADEFSARRLALFEAVLRPLVHERDALGSAIGLRDVMANVDPDALVALRDRAVATMPEEVHAPLRDHVARRQSAKVGKRWSDEDAFLSMRTRSTLSLARGAMQEGDDVSRDVDIGEVLANGRVLMVDVPTTDAPYGSVDQVARLFLGSVERALTRMPRSRTTDVATLVVVEASVSEWSLMAGLAATAGSRGVALLAVDHTGRAGTSIDTLNPMFGTVFRPDPDGNHGTPLFDEPGGRGDAVIVDGQVFGCDLGGCVALAAEGEAGHPGILVSRLRPERPRLRISA